MKVTCHAGKRAMGATGLAIHRAGSSNVTLGMGILQTAATVAVASSVDGRVQRRQQARWAAQDQASAAAVPAPPPPPQYAAPAPQQAYAEPVRRRRRQPPRHSRRT